MPRPLHPQEFQLYNTDCNIPAPPPADSNYVVVDRGHCNPRFVRTTVNVMPINTDVLDKAQIPLAAVITPLAAVGDGEEGVRAVDFGNAGPLRCSRCKAYINPYCRFIDNGSKFEVRCVCVCVCVCVFWGGCFCCCCCCLRVTRSAALTVQHL